MRKDNLVESSLPVQSRISIITLAELEKYWSGDGHNIKTMSQLVSWSVNLLKEVLRVNGKLCFEPMNVTEADRHLQNKGLYQSSMMKRGFKKRATALSFENLRYEGVDPKEYVPRQYNVVHDKNSVEPFEGSGEGIVADSPEKAERIAKLTKKAMKVYNQQLSRPISVIIDDLEPEPEVGIKEGMTDEEMAEWERKDKERLARRKAKMDEIIEKYKKYLV